jgi:hypothetical protein
VVVLVAGVLPPVVGGGVSLSEESAAPPLLMVMDKPGWVNMPVVCCFDTGKKKFSLATAVESSKNMTNHRIVFRLL